MNQQELNQHLSQIQTIWSDVIQAHRGPTDTAQAAQQRLLERYSAAMYRYLMASLHQWEAVEEVYQEFALRFVRGDLKNANPQRGRFRQFLKTTLYHLIVDYRRRHRPRFVPLPDGSAELADTTSSPAEGEDEFLTIWRAELMAQTWEALASHERQTGQPVCRVLRWRTDHPDMRSPQMAEQLSAQLGKPLTPEWVRKRLHQGREKFTDLLLDEIALSLPDPTGDELEQELADLHLLDYCRAALERRRRRDL